MRMSFLALTIFVTCNANAAIQTARVCANQNQSISLVQQVLQEKRTPEVQFALLKPNSEAIHYAHCESVQDAQFISYKCQAVEDKSPLTLKLNRQTLGATLVYKKFFTQITQLACVDQAG